MAFRGLPSDARRKADAGIQRRGTCADIEIQNCRGAGGRSHARRAPLYMGAQPEWRQRIRQRVPREYSQVSHTPEIRKAEYAPALRQLAGTGGTNVNRPDGNGRRFVVRGHVPRRGCPGKGGAAP